MRRSPLRLAGLVLALAGLLALGLWALCGEDATDADAVEREAEEPPEPAPPVLLGPRSEEEEGLEVEVDETGDAETTEATPAAPVSFAIEGVVKVVGTGEPWPYLAITARVWDQERQPVGSTIRDIEAVTDGQGRFRIEVVGPSLRPVNDLVIGAGAEVWRWHVEGDEQSRVIGTEPGSVTNVVLWARPIFRLLGLVEDEHGRPLDGVRILYMIARPAGPGVQLFRIQVVSGDGRRFDLGPFPGGQEGQPARAAGPGAVYFSREGYATLRRDALAVPLADRDRWVVRMTRGHTLAGVLVDEAGRPLADAVVTAEYGDAYPLRRGTHTDANGRWRLDALTPGPMILLARAFADDGKARRDLTLGADDTDVRLVAEAIRLSHPPETVTVLGMLLVDADDEIRTAYDLPDDVHVMVFDPGPDPDRLGIGRLARGNGIQEIGPGSVGSVREAVEALLADPVRGEPGTRVVTTFWDERMSGTNTLYVRLTDEDREALKALLERLER